MERSDEQEFVEIVVTLAKEEEDKQKENKDNNNKKYKSTSKQLFKDYSISKPEQVVSWLLYLIVKDNIKDKAIQLLDRLLIKKGEQLIETLSQSVVDAIKVETIKLLKTTTLTGDSYRQHLFSIIESFANYLLPRDGWNELKPILENIVKEQDIDVTLKDNAAGLLLVLSKYDFKKSKHQLISMIDSYIFGGSLTEERYGVLLPKMLTMLAKLDGQDDGDLIEKIVTNLPAIDTNTPSMIERVSLIIDTLIEMLERNQSGNGFASEKTKIMVFDYVLAMAVRKDPSPTPTLYTDNQIERIISLLFFWLSQIKDVPLEEWTANMIIRYNRDDYDDDNINPEEEYNKEDQLVVANSNYVGFLRGIGKRGLEPVLKQVKIFSKSQQWEQRYAAMMNIPKYFELDFFDEKLFPIILEYYKFVPILLSSLEKHHGTKDSGVLHKDCRINIFSKDLFRFMMFAKKNGKSIDLIKNVLKSTNVFIGLVGKSFAIYLPMIMGNIINVLETPLPNPYQQKQQQKRVSSTLKVLTKIINELNDNDSICEILAPFVQGLIVSLCNLLKCTTTSTNIRIDSLDCLPGCLKLSKLCFGASCDKMTRIFEMVFDEIIISCALETNPKVLGQKIYQGISIIKTMGNDAMTLDQVQSTLEVLSKLEEIFQDMENQARLGNQDVIGNHYPNDLNSIIGRAVPNIFVMIGDMIMYNSAITVPLILISDGQFIQKSCQKLQEDVYDEQFLKRRILYFISMFFEYGGDISISTYPKIIPIMIEFLKQSEDAGCRQNGSFALGMAAKLAKDRFSPWAIDVLQLFDILVSDDYAYSQINTRATENVQKTKKFLFKNAYYNMQQPDKEFIEIIVVLAKEEEDQQIEKKDNNNYKSTSKQLFKEYTVSKPDKVVSWLLYLIVKGTYKTIKEKAVQLLDRLLFKKRVQQKRNHYIDQLSDDTIDAVKFQTIELLNTTLTDTFRKHLFGIIESFATVLIPRCGWNELKPTLENIINRKEEEEGPFNLKDNAKTLMQVLSKYNFEKDNQDMVDILGSLGDKLTEVHCRSLLSMLIQMDDNLEGKSIDRVLDGLVGIYDKDDPEWIQLTPRIIDTMIKVLDRNSEEGICLKSDNKRRIFNFLVNMLGDSAEISLEPKIYTDSKIERIIYHLFYWLLSDIKDISLNEWTTKIESENPRSYYVEQEHMIFNQFVSAFDQSATIPIFKYFYLFLQSQQSWKERYTALEFLSKSCRYLKISIAQQFSTILKFLLKCTVDENVRVRWAAFECLINLSMEYGDLMVLSRNEIFEVIVRSIRDLNDSIQNNCCELIGTIMNSLKEHMIGEIDDTIVGDRVLDAIFSLLERVLQSRKIHIIENALQSLISVINTVMTKRLEPYCKRIIPIILAVLIKYHETKESRVFYSRGKKTGLVVLAIKAFTICGVVIDKKTFSKFLYILMVFVKNNEKWFDMIVDLFIAFDLFIETVDISFAVYLPMIIRVVVNILEIQLPNQLQGIFQSQQRDITKVSSTLKFLARIMEASNDDESISEMMAPFVLRLVDPLCNLVNCPVSTDIQFYSLECLPFCIKLSKIHQNEDKLTQMFIKIFDSAIMTCPSETDTEILVHRINTGGNIFEEIGKDAMTTDQIQSVLNILCKVDQKLGDIAQQVHNGNQAVIGDDQDPEDILNLIDEGVCREYEMLGEIVKHNSVIAVPLITSYPLFIKSCKRLGDNIGVANITKAGILYFMTHYCDFGGEVAINTFPHIIPTIIECLKITFPLVKQNASYALGAAAQVAKDRFSPWAMESLHAIDRIVSAPDAYSSNENIIATGNAISSIGKIIRYVPQINNIHEIIPKWLNCLPVSEKAEETISIVGNLCAIVHLYTNECLGQEYQHVEKIHQIINHYLETCKQEKELLTRTWLLIQERKL
ncbi:hypothetical protein DFA_00469 [Cavenderia fasciculata]|uniref:HEAT repeat-containing protein n=1 Tax=Cavenderia fasciculata TaxID=261658 RepID=F4PS10_CACFS|nr:uncharacterized protein DFA_00469 [Cavenderia fasciculata]EGG20608.1 hypothetical protein DFA_00469 [Cavenderia fasciculata]|eukprot:XP_004358458.1 hypothetical protein DFA_00469 [Cavenderia fasciculata]